MGLFSALLPNFASDAVAVFDQNFNQVFEAARPVKAGVKEEKKLMEHPIETGATITDHVVILPVEIELSMIVQAEDFRVIYEEIKNLYLASTLMTIQTKTSTYQNMVLAQMPHEEQPEYYDAITMALKFREVNFVTAEYGTLPSTAVAKPASASTVQRGEQQPVAAANDDRTFIQKQAGEQPITNIGNVQNVGGYL